MNLILLYDANRLYLEGLHCFLKSNEFEKSHRILSIYDYEELFEHLKGNFIICVLNFSGIISFDITEKIEKILESNSKVKIIVHSHYSDVRNIKKLFDKGIKSFLGFNSTAADLIAALNTVEEGKVYLTEDTKKLLLNFICSVEDSSEKKNTFAEEITAREKDVLELICEGLRSKEIAEKLFISPHTVESHRRNMMLKFNINNSSRLVKFAIDNRLVEY